MHIRGVQNLVTPRWNPPLSQYLASVIKYGRTEYTRSCYTNNISHIAICRLKSELHQALFWLFKIIYVHAEYTHTIWLIDYIKHKSKLQDHRENKRTVCWLFDVQVILSIVIIFFLNQSIKTINKTIELRARRRWIYASVCVCESVNI